MLLVMICMDDGFSIPATSQTPVDFAGPRPQNMSAEVRLSIGLLSLTVRTHLPAWSVEPTQSSCHVECAETDATAARRTSADFILMSLCEREANEASERWIQTQMCSNLRSIYLVNVRSSRQLRTLQPPARNPIPPSLP